MTALTFYTDGSCDNKTGEGGIGVVKIEDKTPIPLISKGTYVQTTSARMEILAVVETLIYVYDLKLPERTPIIIYSDNQYVVNTWEKKWIDNWIIDSFQGRKNKDLWKEFIWLLRQTKVRLRMSWVKGHAGDPFNELADELAHKGRVGFESIIDDSYR